MYIRVGKFYQRTFAPGSTAIVARNFSFRTGENANGPIFRKIFSEDDFHQSLQTDVLTNGSTGETKQGDLPRRDDERGFSEIDIVLERAKAGNRSRPRSRHDVSANRSRPRNRTVSALTGKIT